jgi:hypothetical protein
VWPSSWKSSAGFNGSSASSRLGGGTSIRCGAVAGAMRFIAHRCNALAVISLNEGFAAIASWLSRSAAGRVGADVRMLIAPLGPLRERGRVPCRLPEGRPAGAIGYSPVRSGW